MDSNFKGGCNQKFCVMNFFYQTDYKSESVYQSNGNRRYTELQPGDLKFTVQWYDCIILLFYFSSL